jgi:hypothetical protein
MDTCYERLLKRVKRQYDAGLITSEQYESIVLDSTTEDDYKKLIDEFDIDKMADEFAGEEDIVWYQETTEFTVTQCCVKHPSKCVCDHEQIKKDKEEYLQSLLRGDHLKHVELSPELQKVDDAWQALLDNQICQTVYDEITQDLLVKAKAKDDLRALCKEGTEELFKDENFLRFNVAKDRLNEGVISTSYSINYDGVSSVQDIEKMCEDVQKAIDNNEGDQNDPNLF